MSFRISQVILLFVILVRGQQLGSQTKANPGGFDLVDGTGNIRRPQDYRDRYPALGTFVVLDPTAGDQMHNTYASPGTAEYYRKTGKYRRRNRTGERGLRDRARSNDDGGRALGRGNESLVRDDQG